MGEHRIPPPEEEYALFLEHLAHAIWRRAWVVLLSAAFLATAVTGVGMLQTPTYEASVTMLVEQREGEVDISNLQGDVLGLQQLTHTLATAVDTRPVAEGAAQRLDLQTSPEKLLEGLSVEQVDSTQFIRIEYRAEDPESAGRVANAVGEVFAEKVSEMNPGAGTVAATIWERASAPENPVNPKPLRDGLVAFVFGSMLGIAAVLLMEHRDDRCRSPEQAQRISGLPTLGAVPRFKVPREKKAKSEVKLQKGES